MAPSHLSPTDDPTMDRFVDRVVERALAKLTPPAPKSRTRMVELGKSIAQAIAAGLLAYAAMVYQHKDAEAAPVTDQTSRIAVLEQRVNDMGGDIREIRQDVKTLLSRDSGR